MKYKANELEYFNEFTDKWVTLGLPCTKIRVKPRETQLDLQLEIVSKSGINIVTCGDCGSTLLHRIADETITCPDCGFSSEPCYFADLNY
jgi:predicted RNA-binding Zn-ribbon protein involved in translation (DUF1610 family)